MFHLEHRRLGQLQCLWLTAKNPQQTQRFRTRISYSPSSASMLLTFVKKISRALKTAMRTLQRFLIAEQTLTHLQAIRNHELEVVTPLLPIRGRLLEIGAGTGWQAQALVQRGYEVSAVNLPASNYAGDRVFPVIDYDGHTLPFKDGAFGISLLLQLT